MLKVIKESISTIVVVMLIAIVLGGMAFTEFLFSPRSKNARAEETVQVKLEYPKLYGLTIEFPEGTKVDTVETELYRIQYEFEKHCILKNRECETFELVKGESGRPFYAKWRPFYVAWRLEPNKVVLVSANRDTDIVSLELKYNKRWMLAETGKEYEYDVDIYYPEPIDVGRLE
jgi:hypothetical protein